ncbi:transglutaminase family protein [Rubrimonas sp.]|uniref:transglutaminase family protein n=1 Tax=Rubrimonas sp. TaxID=2036015 RepID=UPI002FDE5263
MILAVSHRTVYRYDPKVAAVAMRLKLFPSKFDGQRPRRWKVTFNGKTVTPEFTNGYGDGVATLFLRGGVEDVEVVAEGEVETTDLAGVLRGFRAPLKPGVCLRPTPRTRADAAILALAKEADAAADTPLDRAHALMDLVSTRIAYVPGATDGATTAAAALEKAAGVCQDHAHVMIAAARALGWPARYVAGYYLPDADGADDLATHAWAEIWVSGIGWIGFDATHDICPTDSYVRVCSGLDAIDAAPLRGHAEGVADETLEVAVTVRPHGAQAQAQSQG